MIIKRGNIHWVQYTDKKGIEKARPMLIISNNIANQCSPVLLCVPLKWDVEASGFLAPISYILPNQHYVSCTDIMAIDRSRIFKRIKTLSVEDMQRVDQALLEVLDLDRDLLSVDGIRGQLAMVELVGKNNNTGHEQRGVRPCVIVSSDLINLETSQPKMLVVYATSQNKKALPTHVHCKRSDGFNKPSILLCEQVSAIYKDRIRPIGSRLNSMGLVNDALKIALGLKQI